MYEHLANNQIKKEKGEKSILIKRIKSENKGDKIKQAKPEYR